MKLLKITNEILLCIVLIMCIFCMSKDLFKNRYDLNNDGQVDSADLLKIRQYLIGQNGKES